MLLPSPSYSRFRRNIAILLGLIAGSGLTGAIAQSAAAGSPCVMYTRDRPSTEGGYAYEEINNCPPLNGTFQNERWRVRFGRWEPAAFVYRGINRRTGSTIELMDDEVRGTTDRPQYLFRNGETLYQVTFRPSNRNTIRLEVFQGDQRILNQLLTRIPD